MILIGHVASVLMATRVLPVHRPTALAAALFPDVADKSLHWLARLTPSDRLWAHTAWALTGTTTLAWALGCITRRSGRGRAWLVGYGVHLLGDTSAPLAFFYPFSRRGYHEGARFRQIMAGKRHFPWRVFVAELLLGLAAGTLELYLSRRNR